MHDVYRYACGHKDLLVDILSVWARIKAQKHHVH